MEKEILKLKPACKDYIWGGRRLIEEYGKDYSGEKLAETWELSSHKDGMSEIVNGSFKGMKFGDFVKEHGEVLGENCKRFTDFPVLIKLIDAKNKLSIQVHPENLYALKNEKQYGKTEMWYVVDAKEDSYIYYGFNKDITKEEFEERIKNDTLTEVLNKVSVKRGDYFLIEAGTIHAIGEGCLIAEIQQNSNITYRVSDYGRLGADGKRRELHIDKAVDVTKRNKLVVKREKSDLLSDTPYFRVKKLVLTGETEINVDNKSFANLLVLTGEGSINGNMDFKKGESFFIPADFGKVSLKGEAEILVTEIPELKNPISVGVDIGGTGAKIGIVNKDYNIIAETAVTTRDKKIEDIVSDISTAVIELLNSKNLKVEDCIGMGVGTPGIIDRKNGVVVYSNNIRIEDVPLAAMFKEYLPMNIKVINDADAATLGEAKVGAGKDYKNFVMITIGTGIGSGVIIDGKMFTGATLGGIEIGHMAIHGDGELCTCGRKGCLEAYASATALRRESKKIMGQEMEPVDLFELAKKGDEKAKKIIDKYIKDFSIGIVNIANMYRPEAIVFGGGISKQGDYLLDPMREELKTKSFGGKYSEVPRLILATMGNSAGIIGAASLLAD